VAADYARIAKQFFPLPMVPFAISVPTYSTAPADDWRIIGNRLRARGPAAPAGYSDPRGALPLREAIAEYVRRSRSDRCDAGQVIITSGTQQGLHLSAQVLIGSDDAVWVENPAYPALTGILETMGRSIVRVQVDKEGLDVDAGRRASANAAAAFVTPSHQYPLGMPMSMRRRQSLIEWARDSGSWVVEDDYDAEMRYAGHPFPSLQGLDRSRVVYLGTFSKVLFPSLRIGYAIVPELLVDPYLGARILMDRHPPTADQHVLATFISEGHLDRHIRRMRNVYAQQHQDLVELLQRILPTELGQVQPCDQGMHMVVWLREDIDDTEVVAAAVAQDVAVRAVSPMYAPGTKRSGLLLGFGGFSAASIESAARQLVRIIKSAATGRSAVTTQTTKARN
jgi:GntR family transcriptional regulator/MocR family aminotransferase